MTQPRSSIHSTIASDGSGRFSQIRREPLSNMDESQIKEQLLSLAKLDGNDCCADCGERDPQWASANLGIFICIACAGIHRKLGVHISRVKSIVLDVWRPEEFGVMQGVGNSKSNEFYEGDMQCYLPVRASTDSAGSIKEQWIRAKYVRKLYKREAGEPLHEAVIPTREGFMTKKGDVVKNWKRRWFSLSGSILVYYRKPGDPSPTGFINVLETARLPECLADPPPNQPYCFTLATPTREYFINADTGEDMYDWIQALRTAKHYLSTPSNYGFSAKANEVPLTLIEQLAPEIVGKALVHKRKFNGKVLTNCAHGAQIVDFLIHALKVESRIDAAVVGQHLLEKGIIHALIPNEPFSDSLSLYSS